MSEEEKSKGKISRTNVDSEDGEITRSNYGVTYEEEAKRLYSGAKTKTFEENTHLTPYAVSSKEDTAYQRQLITRIRVKDQFPIRRITLHPYAVCTAGHQSKICN
ncbi:hypothetical protein Tco_0916024 [Tanacetum coccineum]